MWYPHVNFFSMPNYSSMLLTLKADLDRVIGERDALQNKIERINAAIDALELLAAQDSDAPILEPPPMDPEEEKGFSDRVRGVLQANRLRSLTAVEIRDVLLRADPKADPKITLIHTHNTLKRLERQIEVKEVPREEGKTAYRWLRKSSSVAMAMTPIPSGNDIGVAESIENAAERSEKIKK
jgi:hypothetical protein